MDFTHHMHYPDSINFQFCSDNLGMEFIVDGIDPQLKRPSSPEDMDSPWSPPQMHRYLTDHSKTSYFAYSQADSYMPVTPLPSTILQRQHSPSYSHPSSTCSSALSPPRESDYCQMQSPSTPPETGPLSPYSSGHYEGCGSHNQLYQLAGLTNCIKPVDIFQEKPAGYYDDSCNFTPRTLSMSTDDSHTSVDQCSSTEQFTLARQLSPDSFVPGLKHEMRMASTDEAYPPIEPEDEAISGDEIDVSNIKIEEDDDDYTPNKRAKRPAPITNRATKRCKRSNTSQPSLGATRIKIELDDATAMGSSTKPAIQGTKGSYTCTECPKVISFKDRNGLDCHIKKQHTRPFTCVFEFAGCTSTFASKNEWKRHCCSQHLVLNYWVCQQDQCAKVSNNPYGANRPTASSRSRSNSHRSETNCASTLPDGTIFNRKDLYTQHLRRMHLPSNLKRQVKQKKSGPDQEERERAHQEAALRTRCHLPTYMRCPAHGCTAQFNGSNAWDDRMEHVAKHLEKAAAGTEPPIKFGGEYDKTLTDWATSSSVAIITKGDGGRWELRNPLKPSLASRRDPIEDNEDADAEGEEVDE
ncbi:hypothetical protein F5X96DRAFT_676062 [Biscogniauxia mediterranea]|nr:hypothetical protein F5X96DRAFT_676062 [Biscogniauxia mediterranea]